MMAKSNHGRRMTALSPGSAGSENPLKGFMPFAKFYQERDFQPKFPHSMEWAYLPLSDLMCDFETFTFEQGLEPILAQIALRQHHAVLRVHLDYPQHSSALPQFLRDAGVAVRPYQDFGGGLSPDYDDPQLMTALLQFISAFGQRYDGDPHIGFITVGLVGFWGEWHTYPHDGHTQPEDWMPSPANQDRILATYTQAFPQTKLLIRIPIAQSSTLPIGYHDDSFAFSTLGDHPYDFVRLLEQAGELDKWKREPIGGELRPELQNGIWDEVPPAESQDYWASVHATHASWLLNQGVFRREFADQGPAFDRALKGHQALGYEFQVSRVDCESEDTATTIRVHIRNRGVAPFYYDWPVVLALWDPKTSTPDARYETAWRLSQLLPDDDDTVWTLVLPPDVKVPDGAKVLMQVINPLTHDKPLRFANLEQDQDLPGWLTLCAW